MPIDYEVEYNNRARVPEHPEIFARWQRDGAAYRDEASAERPRRARPALRPERAPNHRPVQAEGRRQRAARAVHPWRLLALARARIVQPFGARPERARRHGRGRGLRSLPAGRHRATSSSRCRPPACFSGSASASASWSTGIRPADIWPACMLATDWKALDPSAPADLVPAAYAISGLFDLTVLLHLSMNADFKLDEAEARRISPLFWPKPKGRVLDAVVGGDRVVGIPAAEPDHRGGLEGRQRDALRGDPRQEPLQRVRCR